MNEYSDTYYSEKPILEKKIQRTTGKSTVVSMVLFIVSFVLFFGSEFRFMIELVALLFIHELGHYLTMKRFGYKGVRMLFVPFMGGFVQGEKESSSQREEIVVAFAGPIPGIIIGTSLWIVGTNWNSAWMLETAYLSFFLNVSNLLPLHPLDGGRVFKSLFIAKFELLQIVFTFFSSLVLIGIGFYFELYILLFFGFIMGVTVRNMHRKYLIHKALQIEKVNYTTTYDALTNKEYAYIKEEVLNYSPTIKKFVTLSIDDDSFEIDQLLAKEVTNNLIPPLQMDMGKGAKLIAILLWISAIIGPIVLISLTSTK